jgi:hypothetical protein
MADKEIVKEFVSESKNLIHLLVALLESIEGDFSRVKKLADYGNMVDRIMGGAQSLAMLVPPDHALHVISDYASLCKAVSYKASQISGNQQLFDVSVALLLDGTETLEQLLAEIDQRADYLKQKIPGAFIERLRWVSSQFSSDYDSSVGGGQNKMTQSEIDQLMKKLGL